MDNCPVYYLQELNLNQSFWFNGDLYTLLDDHIFRGCLRCKRYDDVIVHLRKDSVVVPEWYQMSLF